MNFARPGQLLNRCKEGVQGVYGCHPSDWGKAGRASGPVGVQRPQTRPDAKGPAQI